MLIIVVRPETPLILTVGATPAGPRGPGAMRAIVGLIPARRCRYRLRKPGRGLPRAVTRFGTVGLAWCDKRQVYPGGLEGIVGKNGR